MIGTFFKRIMAKKVDSTVDLVRYLPVSARKGRVLAVGDLHGEYYFLMKALHALEFDFEKDRLLCLGDIHDRGRNSEKCLDLLREPWVDSVLGNHELMLLDSVTPDGTLPDVGNGSLDMWMDNGGEWVWGASKARVAEWRKLLLGTVPLNWVVERRDGRRALVCHAEPDPKELGDILAIRNRPVSVRQLFGSPAVWGRRMLSVVQDVTLSRVQKQQQLRWLEGVLFSVHGHTQLETAGWINNLLFADTGAVFGNRLTLVDLDHVIPGRSNGIHALDIASERLVSYAGTNFYSDPRFAGRFVDGKIP